MSMRTSEESILIRSTKVPVSGLFYEYFGTCSYPHVIQKLPNAEDFLHMEFLNLFSKDFLYFEVDFGGEGKWCIHLGEI